MKESFIDSATSFLQHYSSSCIELLNFPDRDSLGFATQLRVHATEVSVTADLRTLRTYYQCPPIVLGSCTDVLKIIETSGSVMRTLFSYENLTLIPTLEFSCSSSLAKGKEFFTDDLAGIAVHRLHFTKMRLIGCGPPVSSILNVRTVVVSSCVMDVNFLHDLSYCDDFIVESTLVLVNKNAVAQFARYLMIRTSIWPLDGIDIMMKIDKVSRSTALDFSSDSLILAINGWQWKLSPCSDSAARFTVLDGDLLNSLATKI